MAGEGLLLAEGRGAEDVDVGADGGKEVIAVEKDSGKLSMCNIPIPRF